MEDKGGTMRLGAYPCKVAPDSRAFEAYGSELIYERHRHRYEVNNAYRETLIEHGMAISGTSPDNRLVEMIELPDHPWFVASQGHPEFKSRPTNPHPLFVAFVKAAKDLQAAGGANACPACAGEAAPDRARGRITPLCQHIMDKRPRFRGALAVGKEQRSAMSEPPAHAAREYLAYLAVERGSSPATLAAYRRDLRDYLAYLERQGIASLDQVERQTVADYEADLVERPLDEEGRRYAASTVQRHVSMLKGFHKFCVREGLAASDPTATVPLPKKPARLPDVLSIDQVAEMLDKAPSLWEGPIALRNQAILEVLYGCGLRVSELTGLDRGPSIHFEEGLAVGAGQGCEVPGGAAVRCGRDHWPAILMKGARSCGAPMLPNRPCS